MANDKEKAHSTLSYALGLTPFLPFGEKKKGIAQG